MTMEEYVKNKSAKAKQKSFKDVTSKSKMGVANSKAKTSNKSTNVRKSGSR